jgi:hypothetical protein
MRSVLELYECQRWFRNPAVNERIMASNNFLDCLDAEALEGTPHRAPVLPEVEISMRKWREIDNDHSWHAALRPAVASLPEDVQRQAKDPHILERVLAEGERLRAVKAVA